MAEYMSFDDVQRELMVDGDELKRLVSQGELRGFRDGMSMKFKVEDVLNLKKGRDTEPTIILTDSDQEMGINESSDELILDESQSDTVLNLGDLAGGGGGEEEIVFSDSTEEFSISPHDSDPEAAIPTVEVPSLDDDMGLIETDSDSALVASRSAADLSGISGLSGSSSELDEEELGATTEAKPIRMDSADETFELLDDDDAKDGGDFIEVVDESAEDEDDDGAAPGRTGSARSSARRSGGTSGRVSRSARLRAMQMKQRPSELVWSIISLVGVIVLVLPGSIMVNRIQGTTPGWVNGFADNVRGALGVVFEGMLG